MSEKTWRKAPPDSGGGSIVCPYFTYNIQIDLNPEDPSEVFIFREVTDIKEPNKIVTDEFSNVFDSVFDTIQFSAPTSIDIEDFVDLMEPIAKRDDRLDINFDSDCTYCRLKIDGIEAEIEVTSTGISIVDRRLRDPQDLIEAFNQAQRALVDQFNVRTIGFDHSGSRAAIEVDDEK